MAASNKKHLTHTVHEMVTESKSVTLPERLQKEFVEILQRLEKLVDEKNPINPQDKIGMLSSLSFQFNHLLTSWDTKYIQTPLPLLNFLKKSQIILNLLLDTEYEKLAKIDKKEAAKILQVTQKIEIKISEVTAVEKDVMGKKIKSRL